MAQNNSVTAAPAAAPQQQQQPSKRARLTSRFRNCIHRVAALRPQRRRRSAAHTSEVVITSEQAEQKRNEYESDLRRMASLRKLKHTDPEQYKIGCMLLKWYFENKAADPGPPAPGATPPLRFGSGTSNSHRQLRAPRAAPMRDSKFKRGLYGRLPQRHATSTQIPPPGAERGRSAKDAPANDDIVGDLIHMIDEFMDATTLNRRV